MRKEDGKNVEVYGTHGRERRYQSDRQKEGSIFTSGWIRGAGNVIGLCVRPKRLEHAQSYGQKVQTGGNPTLSLYMSSVNIMQNNS